jgi:Zn-dependent alcohol dehydrogenase
MGVREIVGVTRAAWKRDLALACGASAAVAPGDAAAALAASADPAQLKVVLDVAGR